MPEVLGDVAQPPVAGELVPSRGAQDLWNGCVDVQPLEYTSPMTYDESDFEGPPAEEVEDEDAEEEDTEGAERL